MQQIKIPFLKIFIFCFLLFLILIFFSCITQKSHGESIAQKQMNQVQLGFKNIPSDFTDNDCEICKQLEKEYTYCRNLIVGKVNDFIAGSDTIMFIEEFHNDVIGYQTCYIYSSNYKQIKCYKATWAPIIKEPKIIENKTYTLAELENSIRKVHIPSYNDFPEHYSREIRLELIESASIPEFTPGYIVVAIKDGTLNKCLIDIGKQCRTPSASYNIALATKINNDYIFQYFSVSECVAPGSVLRQVKSKAPALQNKVKLKDE